VAADQDARLGVFAAAADEAGAGNFGRAGEPCVAMQRTSEAQPGRGSEVLGGPPRFSHECGDQSAVLRMHAHNGDMSDLGRRFVACFVAAADDAGLPTDPEFRAALRAYMEWAVADVLVYSPVDAVVPAGRPMPHWSWDGLQPSTWTS